MKLLGTIIKSGLMTSGISLLSFCILLFLFQDIINKFGLLWLLGGFFSIATIGISILFLFTPIVLFNEDKSFALKESIINYLPIAIIPPFIIVAAIILSVPEMLSNYEFLIIFINCIISFYTSFIIFFSSLKKDSL